MKNYTTDKIRNVVLIGGTRSGKTTLAEAMLYEGKVIDRRGTVEGKTTVSDNTEVEQLYQRSIYSTPLYAEYKDHKINFIDTPGADDYIGGVISALNVCDSAIMTINAGQGVEVGTEIMGRYAEEHKMPMIIAVNQLDTDKSNWDNTIDSLHQAFGSKPTIFQFPVNAGVEFNSFVDVLKMKMYKFSGDDGKFEIVDVPADLMSKAEDMRAELMEMAAESDEALMEKFFDAGELTEEEMHKGLNIGFVNGTLYPVFCVCGKKDIGVQRLMEFLTEVAPAPKEDPTGKTSLFVYKTALEQHLGDVVYFKVLSGKVGEGEDFINMANDSKERITTLYAVAGKKKERVTELAAGDLGCTVKLKAVKNNQTLNTPGYDKVFPPIEYPQSKYRCAVKAVDEKDEEKLGEALNRAGAEDPTMRIEYSKELRQTIINGMGEQHINILKWHINNDYKIDVELFAPKIPYRETITKVATAEYTHKKQSGGAGQYGRVVLLVEPIVEGVEPTGRFKIDGKDTQLTIKGKEEATLDWGGKFEFVNCVVGGAIDAGFMPAIKKGIMQKMEEGPLTGSYARDIRVYIYDGKMHPVDSKEIAFIIAGRNAFKDAFKQAGPKLLEPIYLVEVMVPGDCMGDVMSDIQNRRGIIEGMGSEKGFQILKARVPLAELYKYSTTLSSLTSGRATFTMSFIEYQQVPMDVQEKLLKAYEEEEKDE
ncbi:MAG: elongation factor G [Bacteroidales bacterium]|nr:elongation factor G [Bacteroidales bacterium]MCR5828229.1 elongation factor G [Bacteroidales bacterium]